MNFLGILQDFHKMNHSQRATYALGLRQRGWDPQGLRGREREGAADPLTR